MVTDKFKVISEHLTKGWIRVLLSILAFGLIYAVYNIYLTSSDSENAYGGAKEHQERNRGSTIPLLYEIPFIIQATGADFNSHIINDCKNFESYATSVHKAAINLGVYAMDIGYLSTYGRTQQALNYMDTCLKLTKVVCGQDAIDIDILERFERNLSNPDSLIAILNQFNIYAITYMDENERSAFGALMLAGAFIEAMYITTQILDTYHKHLLPDNIRSQVLSPLIYALVDRKDSLMDLIELLANINGRGFFELAIAYELQELYDTYPEYDPQENNTEEWATKLLNDAVFLRFVDHLSVIRTELVS